MKVIGKYPLIQLSEKLNSRDMMILQLLDPSSLNEVPVQVSRADAIALIQHLQAVFELDKPELSKTKRFGPDELSGCCKADIDFNENANVWHCSKCLHPV